MTTRSQVLLLNSARSIRLFFYVTFLKISFYRKPRKIFWTVFTYLKAPNTAWRYIARSLQMLYCPLSGLKEHCFELMTGTWRYMRRYSCRPKDLLVLRCPYNFRSIFQAFSQVKCNITVISLFLRKYTRTFVPRFPGIPEMLYFPTSAKGGVKYNISGIPGNPGTNIFPSKQWNICIIWFYYIPGIHKQEAQRATYRAPEYNVPPFWQISQNGNSVYSSAWKTNLEEDVEILLPVEFRWILFCGFREEVENVSDNQRPGRPSCFSDRPEKHKLGRGLWDLASCQVLLNSV